MATGPGLEDFREIFKDQRTHIAVAKILQISMVSDRSYLKCLVSIFPEERQVVARMGWDSVGTDSGIFCFPEINDLVLVAFADGENETGFIFKRLTSQEEKIPLTAVDGSMVLKSHPGKKLWLTANGSHLHLSQGDTAPAENLVLGQQLKTLLVNILTELKTMATTASTHTHTGNLGYPTAPPTQASDFATNGTNFDNLKSSPVNDNTILSSFAFTEKGS